MYGGPFDFNHDGITDGGELALGFSLISELSKKHELSLYELGKEEPDDCFSKEHDEWETPRKDLEENISNLENTLERY